MKGWSNVVGKRDFFFLCKLAKMTGYNFLLLSTRQLPQKQRLLST